MNDLAKEDQQDFAKASAKQKPGKKTPEQMLAEEIQKQTIKEDKAKEATAKPPTRQQRVDSTTHKTIKNQTLNKLTRRKKKIN